MIVGGLDGREDPGPAMAVEEMRDPAPGFSGRDAELHVVPRRELGEKLGRALEQRLAVGRVSPQALEGGPVALGKALGRAVGSEHAEGLEERQPDDRERALAARRLEAVRPEVAPCAATMRSWLSTSVPSTSNTMSFNGDSQAARSAITTWPRGRIAQQRERSLVIPQAPQGLYAQSQKDFSDGRRPK